MRLLSFPDPRNSSEIKEFQHQRLVDLVTHVFQNSPFYRQLYTDAGICEKNISSIKITDLPTINKSMMMKHYEELITDQNLKRKDLEAFISDPTTLGQKYQGVYQVIHSSGTTGNPALYVYGPEDWQMVEYFLLNRISNEHPEISNEAVKVAVYLALDGHYAGASMAHTLKPPFFEKLALNINGSLSETVTRLNAFQPKIIFGYASGIHILAREQLAGRLKISPSQIGCGGDHLTFEMKETIHRAFGISPSNAYACSESVALSSSCKSHSSIHVYTDWNFLEVLDEKGQPVPDGQLGKAVLTNLYNYTQPMIRYEMSDRLVLSPHQCPCGLAFPVLQEISGRAEEFLWFKNMQGEEQFLHPISFAEFFVPGLERFQIAQNGTQTFELRVTSKNPDIDTSIRMRMDSILQDAGLLGAVTYTIKPVSDIPNDPKTGKFRLVLPHSK